MTATLYPNRRADRVAPRPIGFGPRASRTHSVDTTAAVAGVADGTDGTVNYAIRRTAAALLAVVVVAITVIAASAMVGAIGDVGGRPAAASDITSAVGAPIVRVHVAQAGDTLWSIADLYRGEVGQNRFVDALIDVNGGTVIQVGQAVRLP